MITKTPIVYRVNPKKPLSPPKVGTISIAQVMAVKIGDRDVEQVSDIALEMQFSGKKTIFGKKISFTAKPDAALIIVRWLEQEKSRNQ